jgi:hypothetical protein
MSASEEQTGSAAASASTGFIAEASSLLWQPVFAMV